MESSNQESRLRFRFQIAWLSRTDADFRLTPPQTNEDSLIIQIKGLPICAHRNHSPASPLTRSTPRLAQLHRERLLISSSLTTASYTIPSRTAHSTPPPAVALVPNYISAPVTKCIPFIQSSSLISKFLSLVSRIDPGFIQP